jgi:outer membrane biosynthesis protein TonB
MIKKMSLLFVMASLVVATSCKKEDSTSIVDSTAASPAASEMATDKTPPPADGKYPAMTFDTKEHDFGLINQGDKVEYNFKFTNTGEADLIINSARGTCGCTVPEYPKEAVKPGESGKIKVSFNSTGKKGATSKSVFLSCNTKDGKEKLEIKANIAVPEGSEKK